MPVQGLFLGDNERQKLFLCENEMVNSHMISLSNSLTVINCVCTNCDSEKKILQRASKEKKKLREFV